MEFKNKILLIFILSVSTLNQGVSAGFFSSVMDDVGGVFNAVESLASDVVTGWIILIHIFTKNLI